MAACLWAVVLCFCPPTPALTAEAWAPNSGSASVPTISESPVSPFSPWESGLARQHVGSKGLSDFVPNSDWVLFPA